MTDEKRLQRALDRERKKRERIAEQARQTLVKAGSVLSELQARDHELETRQKSAMADPADRWLELRDLRDEREYLKISIARAATARADAATARARASQRAQDGMGIRQAAALAVKVGR